MTELKNQIPEAIHRAVGFELTAKGLENLGEDWADFAQQYQGFADSIYTSILSDGIDKQFCDAARNTLLHEREESAISWLQVDFFPSISEDKNSTSTTDSSTNSTNLINFEDEYASFSIGNISTLNSEAQQLKEKESELEESEIEDIDETKNIEDDQGFALKEEGRRKTEDGQFSSHFYLKNTRPVPSPGTGFGGVQAPSKLKNFFPLPPSFFLHDDPIQQDLIRRAVPILFKALEQYGTVSESGQSIVLEGERNLIRWSIPHRKLTVEGEEQLDIEFDKSKKVSSYQSNLSQEYVEHLENQVASQLQSSASTKIVTRNLDR